jgi:hypothetical protein
MDENLLKGYPPGLIEILKKIASAVQSLGGNRGGKSVIEIAQSLNY